jgi:hypothetical protein
MTDDCHEHGPHHTDDDENPLAVAIFAAAAKVLAVEFEADEFERWARDRQTQEAT